MKKCNNSDSPYHWP